MCLLKILLKQSVNVVKLVSLGFRLARLFDKTGSLFYSGHGED